MTLTEIGRILGIFGEPWAAAAVGFFILINAGLFSWQYFNRTLATVNSKWPHNVFILLSAVSSILISWMFLTFVVYDGSPANILYVNALAIVGCLVVYLLFRATTALTEPSALNRVLKLSLIAFFSVFLGIGLLIVVSAPLFLADSVLYVSAGVRLKSFAIIQVGLALINAVLFVVLAANAVKQRRGQ